MQDNRSKTTSTGKPNDCASYGRTNDNEVLRSHDCTQSSNIRVPFLLMYAVSAGTLLVQHFKLRSPHLFVSDML